jgi:DNA repair protein RecO (recombination protein O)
MSLLKTPAIVLRSRKWGEADRIVTFYTLRFGKLRGVARGARRLRNRFGSALEPFVHGELNLFEKRGDSLYRITGSDIRDSFSGLREDLSRMSAAARMANFVSAVTGEGDAHAGIFDTLLDGLRVLQRGHDPALTALLFQIKLLGETGFRPQTDHCAACGDGRGRAAARHFSPLAGGLVCPPCARRDRDRCLPLSAGSLALLQQALRWAPAALTRLKATGQIRDELEAAVESYVTIVAGRHLPPADFLTRHATL